jgi:hypothetical protein
MSTAKLNIWITKKGDPCRIDNNPKVPKDPKKPEPIQLFVFVLHCNGEILEWCGQKYVGMQATCGQLEIEIPPGCYIVGAVERPQGRPPLGNHLTHIAVVRANCGDHICVTLFNPTFHFCSHWWLTAAREHAAAGGQALLPQAAVSAMNSATQSITDLLKTIPKDPLTAQMAQIDDAPPPKTTAPEPASSSGAAKSSKGAARKRRK